MDSLAGYIATGVASLGVGIFLHQLEPKAKVCYWFTHNFLFNMPKENVVLQTNSLTIQNLGRKSAEEIEIIHKSRPDFFEFPPSVSFQENSTPAGDHIISIKSLGAKEFITLQLLSYKTIPSLKNIRSKEGIAQLIPITVQRVYPQTVQFLILLTMLIGFGFSLYWIIRSISFLSKSIGLF